MQCATLDSFAAFADDVPAPVASRGNSWSDMISGIISGVTPAATAAASGALNRNLSPAQRNALAGITARPQPNYLPMYLGGAVLAAAAVYFIFLRKRR